jgi:2-methylcitrate dehydratase PrpD
VAGCPARLDAQSAALANGVAGHALDYDDTQLSTTPEGVYGLLTHPSVPVLAATTAVAEQLGVSGRDLTAAYIIGVEVACRIAAAISPRHYQAGFHSTGTMAGIGAAAGAGRLLALPEDRLTMALSTGKLGRPFFLAEPGISIKPYPSGSLSHPAQDLILDLVREQDLGPDDIERIEVGTNSNVLNALIHHRPVTGLQGKFSMEYRMTTAVLRRRAGPADFTDEAVLDPTVQAFLPRVRVAVDDELEALGYQHVRTRVRVRSIDGTVYERVAEHARGYPASPLTADELDAKFRSCAYGVLDPPRANAAIRAIRQLAAAARVRDVTDFLVAR